jgi:hypothetical protein
LVVWRAHSPEFSVEVDHNDSPAWSQYASDLASCGDWISKMLKNKSRDHDIETSARKWDRLAGPLDELDIGPESSARLVQERRIWIKGRDRCIGVHSKKPSSERPGTGSDFENVGVTVHSECAHKE